MSNHPSATGTNRRQFLKTSAAASSVVAAPYFFSQSKTVADESKAKIDRIPIGLIGAGDMGAGNIRAAIEWLDLVAIADVDHGRRERLNQELAGGKASLHSDYREVLQRDDIRVLHIATPDHWHTKPLVEAMLAGKDVYCEKPLTLTIDEGKLIRRVQEQTGQIVQVGTQQRSAFGLFTKAMAIVHAGRLGKIKRVQAAIGGAPASPVIPVSTVSEELDWERWLGPAPLVDYRWLRIEENKYSNCHFDFRWWYDYSGGKLTDWGAHHVDIATWAMAINGQNPAPVSISGSAEHPVPLEHGMPTMHDRYNTATTFNFTVKYADGAELVIRSDTENGVLIEGDEGRIFVNRGKLVGKPVEDLEENPLPENAIQKAYKGLPVEHNALSIERNARQAHWANFLHCVKTRQEPISDVHSHMQMLNVCHLAGICGRLGRELKWDNNAEQIIGDAEANSFLSRVSREGYTIEM